MRLRTFGGLALDAAEFTRPKPLVLSTYLALEGPQARRLLAELFWPRAADPMKSLTVALARVRTGAPGLVEADRERAWTDVDSDAERFLALLEEGDEEAALAVYSGPFLNAIRVPNCSVEVEEWTVETREFLASRARAALLARAETKAAHGGFRAAAEDAAVAYGLPGAAPPEPEELGRIHDLLRAGDHPLAGPVRTEAATFGIEVAASPERARARAARHDARVSDAPAHHLPSPATSFIGRREELAALGSLLSRPWCRLVALVGPAGVGKTRLALHAAHRQALGGAHPAGVRFVPLETLARPRLLPTAIADALGLDAADPEDPVARIVDHVRDRPLLLLLDNFEHLAEAALVLPRLLDGCPGLQLLVTSRVRLDLAEEHVFTLDGLPYPDETELPTPKDALSYDAVRLFVRRAQRVHPAFEANEETVRAIVRICRLTGGLPLGLELAAAWVRVLPCEEIAREIGRDLDFLATKARNVPPRHRSMRASFEHSWRLLTRREGDVLRRLSVFRGGFRRDAAREVAGAGVSVLASLLDKSLLRVDRDGRYDRHPLLYGYTQEKAAADPDLLADARAKHARHYRDRLRAWRTDLRGGGQARALAAIDDELANLRAAWSDPEASADLADAPDMAWTLAAYFEARQAFFEGIDFFGRVLERTDPARPDGIRAHAHLLIARARLVLRLGRYDEAERLAEQGLSLLDGDDDDVHGRLAGLRVRAATALHEGDHAEAERRYRDALTLARTAGDAREIGIDTGHLGLVLTLRGDREAARRHLESALRLAREHDDRLGIVESLNGLGLLHDMQEDLIVARARWQEALVLSREVGDRRMSLKLLVNLAMIAHKLGDHDEAHARNAEALIEARRAGDRMLESVVLAKQGWTDLARGDADEAQSCFASALRVAAEIGETQRVLEALGGMAEVRVAQDRPVRAAVLLAAVAAHPVAAAHVREEAERLLERLDSVLPGSAHREAVGEGAAADMDELVADVLRESGRIP